MNIVRKLKITELPILIQLFNYKDIDDMIAENTRDIENGVIDMKNDCIYVIGNDTITKGILINKNLTINGNRHIINALGQTRIFNILSNGVSINNIAFKNGKATHGGAIYLLGRDTSISNCSFENNAASQQGGAIYVNSGSKNTISTSTFTNNSAISSNAGAVYLGSSSSIIQDSKFINNKASTTAGAIYVYGYGNTISNSKFVNNTDRKQSVQYTG